MSAYVPHLTVCICTFRRPELLTRLLQALLGQRTDGRFTYSAVVADNDAERSAEPAVEAFVARSSFHVTYCVEPEKNIALARNRALAAATGEYVAFIDDDEFPVPDWLRRLLETCERYDVSGVLGPVRPHFESTPPAWIIRGGFCERPEHPTGTIVPWQKSRTGNVLFRRTIVDGEASPFRPQFGAGGEDVDFFQRQAAQGRVFVWCNEAVAYEVVPPFRWTRRYMLQRALLRGRSNMKVQQGRLLGLAKSFAAVPLYTLALPGALLLGQHVFMRYGIRCCDHLGRVLALVGLNPVKERPM